TGQEPVISCLVGLQNGRQAHAVQLFDKGIKVIERLFAGHIFHGHLGNISGYGTDHFIQGIALFRCQGYAAGEGPFRSDIFIGIEPGIICFNCRRLILQV
ncbi:MAG TPA: hypothetical protein DCY74_03400, partial [Clostridiales bacterium]|nr:hypothetical protein [Clostridiales bacterium]